ncbi:uncharacterized protein LOC143538216 [Bidens hawaiensis]|uniref:uncharacterized protein LOC143538216 n=1 Tax=Bidens hawaiensis TaxID=980011 RepID=UPI00404B4B1B
MVQRKVANKIGIKSHLHKLDTKVVNHKPSSSLSSSPSLSCSSQAHEKLKKIMKKSRSIKRPDDHSTPFKNKKTPPSPPQKQSPNYMKSTSSFEARKEQYSPSPKTPTPKGSKGSKSNEPCSSNKGSRTSSLKMVRTLTKTPSFKPTRSSKKVILCEDVDSQRATCSSTLKDSKFPNYLQLNDGGNELDGTSAMKVCPYSYCSLNGHHHAPVPPLKCFLSARRRPLKTQKGFKLGCLSPRQIKPSVKKSAIKEPVVLAQEEADKENKDFFIDIYHKEPPIVDIQGKDVCIKLKSIKEPVILAQEEVDMEEKDFLDNIFSDDTGRTFVELQDKDVCIKPELVEPYAFKSLVHQVYNNDMENKGVQDFECSDLDWEERYCSNSDQMEKTSVERLYNEHQKLYNVRQELYNKHQELYDEKSVSSGAWSDEDGDYASDSLCQPTKIDQDNMNHDPLEVSSSSSSSAAAAASESDITNKTDDLQNLNHPIKDQNENNQQQSKTVPESAEKSNNETTKCHTTIIYNIINFNISVFINGKKTATVQVPAASVAADNMQTEEPMKEPCTSNEDNIAREINQIIEDEQPLIKVQDIASTELLNETENHDNPEQECNHSNSIDAVTKMTEEPVIISDPDEVISETDINLRGRKKPCQETEGEQPEFNPRGPNFLPETADPDAEKVDLKHQAIDERKNAEEWMVDFALQQAVTTLAPARKKKVALLVEAFEKVMPDLIPRYETHKHVSKEFTNSRPMQACS